MEVQVLKKEVTDLKVSVALLEKERDFYFAKLRDVEVLCQTPELENISLATTLKKIIYDADEKEDVLAEAQQIISQSLNEEEQIELCNMPAVETPEPEQTVVNSKGTARRKLSLPDDKSNDKINKDGNEIAAESLAEENAAR
ncbi:hypothetical protein OROMI_023230 [Orobanche minor]